MIEALRANVVTLPLELVRSMGLFKTMKSKTSLHCSTGDSIVTNTGPALDGDSIRQVMQLLQIEKPTKVPVCPPAVKLRRGLR